MVRKEAKLPERAGLHSLRHSIATRWALAGAGAPQLAALLGHAQVSTVERYIHFAANAHRALAEQAAAAVLVGVDTFHTLLARRQRRSLVMSQS